ncbi:DUF1217 domain-containing protein [Rhizobium sp. RAF56]|uniref:DUF1217 domain-containing protein n=1 Tax=Rhizobium sp. RAF56 TaxID=3233062 RepID=UPI003F9A643E
MSVSRKLWLQQYRGVSLVVSDLTRGGVPMISTFLGYSMSSRDMVTTLTRVSAQAQTKREVDYYKANIGKVKTADDFLGDYRLYSYAMKAFGLEDMVYAKGMMKKVLESDLSDTKSFANKLTDTRYKQFAAAFNFGVSANSGQTDTQQEDMLGLYTQSFANEESSIKTESDYFSARINNITNVMQLVADPRMKNYLLKAYGLDPTYVRNGFLASVLTSDVNDPNSFVNLNGGTAFKAMAKQFSFNADGTVPTLSAAQLAEEAAVKAESDYYGQTIGSVTSVDGLLGDSRLTAFMLKGYGIDPASVSTGDLRSMLTSDISDPASFVNQNGTAAEKKLIAQFNFAADGTLALDANGVTKPVQTAAQKAAVMDEYNITVPSFVTDAGAAALDSYYKANITNVKSIADLVADPRLDAYVRSAFRIDPSVTDADMVAAAKDPRIADAKRLTNLFIQFNFSTGTANEDAYYDAHIGTIDNITELTSDTRMMAYLKLAYGIDPSMSADLFRQAYADPAIAAANGLTDFFAQFNFQDHQAAQSAATYYSSNIGNIKTASDLTGDAALFSFVKAAYGIDPSVSATDFEAAVEDPALAASLGLTDALAQFGFQARANAVTEDDYYKATIGSITSVDDLVADPRLFDYIKTAFNMTSVTPADFAAAAKDPALAQAKGLTAILGQFSFEADGTVTPGDAAQSAAQISLISTVYIAQFPGQTDEQASATAMAYLALHPAQTQSQGETVANAYHTASDALKADALTNTAYYQAHIGTVTSADDLSADTQLFNYLKIAYGLDLSMTAAEFSAAAKDANQAIALGLVKVFADFNFGADGTVLAGNQAQSAAQIAKTTQAYTANFATDGTVTANGQAQTSAQIKYVSTAFMTNYRQRAQTAEQKSAVMDAYSVQVSTFVTNAKAAASDSYYKSHIGSITSAAELVNDPMLFDYVVMAFGIADREAANTSDAVLKFDFKTAAADPDYAKLVGFTDIIATFNFLPPDGKVAAGKKAQTADQIASTSQMYFDKANTARTAMQTDAAANYKKRMPDVKNIKDFFVTNDADTLKDNDKQPDLPQIYEVALRAYGIQPSEMSPTRMKLILESDPYDPKSYVNSLKDDRFVNLAKAFNFDSKGDPEPAVQALSQQQINSYVSAYSKRASLGLTGSAAKKALDDAKTAATYFATNILKIKTLPDFLADKKLTDFTLAANGIDPKTVTAATLKSAFEADPDDPKSFLNTTAGAQFKKIVSTFNFETKAASSSHLDDLTSKHVLGLTNTKLGTIQDKGAFEQTNDSYLHQALETQQGETNDGVRLALYFQRKAPDILSIYDLMSDKAIYQFITTTFQLPDAIANMDVQKQADYLQKLVSLKDLQDPKKVSQLVKRFTAMYDMKNSSSSSPAASILQGSSGGISADTLLSIAQLRAG